MVIAALIPPIVSDGRSGRNRNRGLRDGGHTRLYPMGDRGGTATVSGRANRSRPLYPMGDRGGTATRDAHAYADSQLYPMGDRGGTATGVVSFTKSTNCIRWEIGEEPQHPCGRDALSHIVSDGRSGRNRNIHVGGTLFHILYPMGDRGGTATDLTGLYNTGDCIRWEIGEEPQQRSSPCGPPLKLYPMGDRGGTATGGMFGPEWFDCIRWEIGEEPQHSAARPNSNGNCIRWEIGEEPQRSCQSDGCLIS